MKGQEQIIAMRKAGKRPSFVFINDWECDTDWEQHGDHATVSTFGDVVQLLDLRFLVGLKVSISSKSEIRAKALFDHCKAAGASCVGSCHVLDGVPAWKQSGWSDVWHRETVSG
jgi:hypothetical protein